MTKLDKAKKVIEHYYTEASCGIFNTHNLVNDPMETLYEESDVIIDICRPYEYFEVFGLSEEEFSELEKFYMDLETSVYSPHNPQRLDEDIREKLTGLEESIEIRNYNKPYTMKEKYNLCVKLKRILDMFMD